jgi:ADP-heptose:LPS heptosyltransferase
LKKILVIQTAFIGDVILATALLEKLHQYFPTSSIDVLVRQGNESLLKNHPFINRVLVWEKKVNKYKNLFKLAKKIRQSKYDLVINLQRHAGSGFLTWRSNGKQRIGFNTNPLSFFYTEKYPHQIGNGKHEVERNQLLIENITDAILVNPKLYPASFNYSKIDSLQLQNNYIVIAPSSVWFTKQIPKKKVIELINKQNNNLQICLIGASTDFEYCESIISQCNHTNIINLTEQLSLLDSAALIEKSQMNYVNDSAPLHIASAMNAPVTAFFCSTLPSFGFGPLSDESKIVQNTIHLDCRPCGLHGYNQCPKGHFKCGLEIEV